MKILACGDIVGKKGRSIILEQIPILREKLDLDFVVVNGENSAHGFGIKENICEAFFQAGIDVITMGNHTWDQRDIIQYIEVEKRLIRPANYPEHTSGSGFCITELKDGRKVAVLQLMGTLFIDPLDNPFAVAQNWFSDHRLKDDLDAIIVDFHAEASSEKVAFGHFCDGRASLVFGTHTHIPTADARILNEGTAFISDVGMCGDYDSVIGMDKTEAVRRFVDKIKVERLSPANGEATLCAVYVETDDETGLALKIEPIRIGGRLAPSMPL